MRRRGNGEAARPAFGRRHVLGLGALVPLAAACTPTATAFLPPPAGPPVVRTVWRRRPDGPPVPIGDEGRLLIFLTPDQVKPTVDRGALVGNLPARSSASYVTQVLDRRVTRIGAQFGFDPGSTSGSLTLIAWIPGRPLTAPFHVALAPDRWIAATVENGDLTELDSGDYRSPLVCDGRPYRAEVVVQEDTTTLALPDGQVVAVTDEATGRLDATVACWEFFRQSGDGAPVRLYETWAA